MGCPGEIVIGQDLVFSIDTHDPDTLGSADADSAPTYRVYEGLTATPILTGTMALLDDANTTGCYAASIACTTANGFEDGKTYTIRCQATVSGETAAISYGVRAVAATRGSGARSVTITVDDGTDPLENALVRLKQGAESFTGLTDASGEIVFAVDDATWEVRITKAGYSFTTTTIVVNGDETATYSMTGYTFTPSAAGTVTGYLYVKDEEGEVEAGVDIDCTMTAVPEDDMGVAYDSAKRTVTSAETTGLCEFPGLVLGATYTFVRGADTSSGTFTRSLVVEVLIPLDAADPYALPSIIGTP